MTNNVAINIGGMAVVLHTDSSEFAGMLEERYGGFVTGIENQEARSKEQEAGSKKKEERSEKTQSAIENRKPFELEIELAPPGIIDRDEEVHVRLDRGRWVMERGDFRAEWDLARRQGWVRQTANPYSIDSVLRILHSLVLAREGGFLVHAASAIRNGRAFLFAGVSGAGKTTISRLAPPDVALLTDEISYVRREARSKEQEARSQESGVSSQESEVRTPSSESPTPNSESRVPSLQSPVPGFEAFGTPFAGELARIGANLRAPVAALYLLAQGAENRIERVSHADAARALLQNILFFAQDAELVRLVFQSVLDFVSCVSVRRLVFAPEARVWELIR